MANIKVFWEGLVNKIMRVLKLTIWCCCYCS